MLTEDEADAILDRAIDAAAAVADTATPDEAEADALWIDLCARMFAVQLGELTGGEAFAMANALNKRLTGKASPYRITRERRGGAPVAEGRLVQG